MQQLPSFNTDITEFSLMQSRWASILNPLLGNPFLNGQLLQSVALASGANVINHKLGRKLQGWVITRNRANSTVYDTQDANTQPALTLQLTASGATTVDLWVF